MRKSKFNIGQNVHVIGNQWSNDFFGEILRIDISQIVSTTKIQMSITYSVKCNGVPHSFSESKLFATKNSLLKNKRSRAKAGAKSAITRVEKTLKKNKNELALLKEKLVLLKE